MIDNLIFIQNELDKLEKEKINLQKKISFNFKRFTIFLSKDNYYHLKYLKSKTNTSINKILNYSLWDFKNYTINNSNLYNVVKLKSDNINYYVKLFHSNKKNINKDNVKSFLSDVLFFYEMDFNFLFKKKKIKRDFKFDVRLSEENFLLIQLLKEKFNLTLSDIFNLMIENNLKKYINNFNNQKIFSLTKKVLNNLNQAVIIKNNNNLFSLANKIKNVVSKIENEIL
ncbi:MAG: hypothetical protein KBA67_08020 [Leptotrichiaceae bacterium]|nr:hypothetical protein [Leptotrichiaceae bacterium]MBP7101456.1 hypothetical protein [Leptotrichiaceae bacterium]